LVIVATTSDGRKPNSKLRDATSKVMMITLRSPLLSALLPMAAYVLTPSRNNVLTLVEAFPTGAGGCQTGAAAVNGLHLQNGPGESTLEGLGIQISVDGDVLSPGAPVTVAAGADHTVTVTATGTPFKGFLLALSASTGETDLSTALTPVDNTTEQPAGVCDAPVVGVTHTSNADKTTASATLSLDGSADLNLDVTVVLQNSGGVSSYGYERFAITVAPAQATYVHTQERVAFSLMEKQLRCKLLPAPALTACFP
jgi:hypothetical protein